MTPEIDKLRAEAAAAETALNTLKAQRTARIESATHSINEEFRERIPQDSLANMKAERAVTDAISSGATHEWEGKKVQRLERIRKGSAAWNRTYEDVTVYGVVEVRRNGTKFADNSASWRLPVLGQAFVRYLKKDGTPGLKIDDRRVGTLAGWSLVK